MNLLHDMILKKFLATCLVVDTESTGIDPAAAEICELASTHGVERSSLFSMGKLFGTHVEIPWAASSKNNISRDMLAGLPSFLDNAQSVLDILHANNADIRYHVAHNARYDATILRHHHGHIRPLENLVTTQRSWLCTYRVTHQLYPKHKQPADFSYQLNYLRYAFDFKCDELSVHRATDDTQVCWMLLHHLSMVILEKYLPQQVLHEEFDLGAVWQNLTDMPIIYHAMPFGKHRGTALCDVPDSYFSWMITNLSCLDDAASDYDADLAASIEQELQRRGHI